jgi:membrane protease YdiL (CAAX protease family)
MNPKFPAITTRAVLLGLVGGAAVLALLVLPFWDVLTSGRWLPWTGIGVTLALQGLMAGVVLGLLALRRGSFRFFFGPLNLPAVVVPAVRLGVLQFLTSAGLIFLSFGLVAMFAAGALEALAARGRDLLSHDAGRLDPLVTALTLASAALVAPVCEEILFRGFLFQRWATRWGLRAGLLASAVVFGLLHFDLFPPAAFLAGLVGGVLYVRTRSLFAAMISHLVNNGVIALLALANEFAGGRHATTLAAGDARWLLGAGGVLLAIGGPLLVRELRRMWPRPDDPIPYEANAAAAGPPGP